MEPIIRFETHPDNYRHWKLSLDGSVATLALDVSEDGGLIPEVALKLNSYDLSVDIELNDAVQRLRFEHPEVKAVIVTSAKDRVFCAGANIAMLGRSSHMHKVNFCKFTNETRNSIEDSSAHSGQTWICAANGTAAGGGYELAMACDWIILADDGSTAVSLPEVPLLAVLPGTGGLTRLVDKRRVRRDRADVFCTLVEGIKGKRAVEWRLVDETAPRSKLMEAAKSRALAFAAKSDRPDGKAGIILKPLARRIEGDQCVYPNLTAKLDRATGAATITLKGPSSLPSDLAGLHAEGPDFWPLALARELEDLIFHLRFNELEIGSWVFKTEGDAAKVLAADKLLLDHGQDWLAREIILYWRRTLKRLDTSARSLFAFIEPGSCFAGTLLEVALAADRSYMLDGQLDKQGPAAPALFLSAMNFGSYAMGNGLTRLETRFIGDDQHIGLLRAETGKPLDAAAADELGLVTFIPDAIDWDDEVRLAIEERASYSPDSLTGLEANLRFAGPETAETKIFARLSAWQNWIFQRPNAAGPEGALKLYGTGKKAAYDKRRV